MKLKGGEMNRKKKEDALIIIGWIIGIIAAGVLIYGIISSLI